MKKNHIIPFLLLPAVLAYALFGILNLEMSDWPRWAGAVPIATIILITAIAFCAYQHIWVQRRKDSLEQVRFLKSLAEEFTLYRQRFLEACPILVKYNIVPKEMDDEEYSKVVDALSNCYKTASFLFRVAQLVKKQVIDEELLYIFFYKEITAYWRRKLRFLIQWCGTGLDLGADYDSYELARVVTATRELKVRLDAIHEKHGADLEIEGYAAELERFEQEAGDFLADPSRYAVSSDNYMGNYVTVKEYHDDQ